MFYHQSQIDSILECDICKERLIEPKCLPCGNIACNICILDKVNKSNNYECKFCSEIHIIPKNGLITPFKLNELLKQEPNEIYRGKLVKDTKIYLNEIQTKVQYFTRVIQSPRDLIKETFMDLRNQLELARETTNKLMNGSYEKFMKELDLYEKKCIDNLSNNERKIKAKITEIENETNEFYDKWIKYLNNFDLKESELKNAQLIAKRMIDKLIIEEDKLKLIALNGKRLTFHNQNKLHLCETNNNGSFFSNIFKFDGNLFSSEKNKIFNYGINISTCYIKMNNLKVTKLNKPYVSFPNLFTQTLIKINDNICPHLYFFSNNINSVHGKNSIIYYYNNRFTLEKASHVLNHTISCLEFYKNRLYCLTGDKKKIHIYNTNFYLIQTIGQETDKNEPYFLKNITSMRISNDRFIFTDSNGLVILMDINNGSVLSRFEINGELVGSYKENFLITYDQKSICFYEFDGLVKHEFRFMENEIIPLTYLGSLANKKIVLVKKSLYFDELYEFDTPEELNEL